MKKDTKLTLAATAAGAISGTGAALGMQYAKGFSRGAEGDDEITDAVPTNDPAAPFVAETGHTDTEKANINNTSNIIQESSEEDDEIIDGVAFDANGDGIEDGIAYDLNGDGVIDAVTLGVDTDGDGVMDAVAVVVDGNGDGIMDAIQMDLNGDGVMDAVAMDFDQDGIMEYLGVDSDGDRRVETHFVDTNADSYYDLAIQDVVTDNDVGDQSEYDTSGDDDIAYDMDNNADVSDWA